MTDLIVNSVDESIIIALTARAALNGISAEEEHRRILVEALLKPTRKSLADVLLSIPNVGNHFDFERVQKDRTNNT